MDLAVVPLRWPERVLLTAAGALYLFFLVRHNALHTTSAIGINVLTTLAALVLTFITGRAFGLLRRTSAAITLLFALSPLFLFAALRPAGDLSAVAWTLAAVLCAWRTEQHWAWGFAAGAVFVIAGLLHPANGLLCLPIAACLASRTRAWLATSAGAVVLWAIIHRPFFAETFPLDDISFFAPLELPHATATLWLFAKWLPVILTPFVVAALGLPFARVSPRMKRVLVAWVASFVLAYAAYGVRDATWRSLDVLLPALPALLVAAGLVWQERPLVTFSLAVDGSIATPRGGGIPRNFSLRLPQLAFVAALVWQLAWNWHLQLQGF